jgi:hypothetical protein
MLIISSIDANIDIMSILKVDTSNFIVFYYIPHSSWYEFIMWFNLVCKISGKIPVITTILDTKRIKIIMIIM